MTSHDAKPVAERFSLSRWSERKRASARGAPLPGSAPADASASAVPSATGAPPARATNTQPTTAQAAPASDALPLPPVDSLTFDSDFTVFMNANVDEAVKRSALRKLLRDPRFNVMDGLDTYIDDYSLPDPIPPSMLAELRHSVATLNPVFDHPQADAPAIDVASDPALMQAGEPAIAVTVDPALMQAGAPAIGMAAEPALTHAAASATPPVPRAATPAQTGNEAFALSSGDAQHMSGVDAQQATEPPARENDEASASSSAQRPAGSIANRNGA